MNRQEKALLDSIGLRVKMLRERRCLTQEQLASRANLSKNSIGNIERLDHKPTLLVVIRIAKALNISLGEFFAPIGLNPNENLPSPPLLKYCELVSLLPAERQEIVIDILEGMVHTHIKL